MRGTIAAWVFDNMPLPARLQPYVFGLIVGRWPRKAKGDPKGSPRETHLEYGHNTIQEKGNLSSRCEDQQP